MSRRAPHGTHPGVTAMLARVLCPSCCCPSCCRWQRTSADRCRHRRPLV